jgi:hypothetical protein
MDICAQQRIPVELRYTLPVCLAVNTQNAHGISVGAAKPRGTLLTVEGQMQSGFEYRAADGAPTGLDLMIGTRPHPSAIG